MTNTTNNGKAPAAYFEGGTRVLNTTDGEPGTVLNGYAQDAAGAWTEYEVETTHAIEIWKAAEMIDRDRAEKDAGC